MSKEKFFTVIVVSQKKGLFYKIKSHMVICPGENGMMGIYYGHSQLISKIKPGFISIKQKKVEDIVFYVSGGIVEIQPDQITILVDILKKDKNIT